MTSRRCARSPTTPCRCSPRTRARASSGTSSASPVSRRASGPTCGCAARSSARSGWSTCCVPVPRRSPPAVATAATLARLLEEERRLFYVAVTRARRALLVTAVTSEREGLSPSRFLDEVDPLDAARPETAHARCAGRCRSPAWWPTCARSWPTRRCSGGAAHGGRPPARDARRRGCPGRRPRRLVGARRCCPTTVRCAEADEPVAVSPSKVESFRRCELRWFLEHVGGGDTAGAAQTVGTLVHAVAEAATTPDRRTEAALQARLQAAAAHGRPRHRLGRAARSARRPRRWCGGWRGGWPRTPREVVATELEFAAEVGRARLGGRVDRIERDDLGRAVVIDLKTGAGKVQPDELPTHGQLATYQLAVESGAFEGPHRERWRRARAGRQGRRHHATPCSPAATRRGRGPELGPAPGARGGRRHGGVGVPRR